jgi:hypothetical protein
MSTQTPDFAALAKSLGLDAATYPALELFKHLGVGESLGWQLVGAGKLRGDQTDRQKDRHHRRVDRAAAPRARAGPTLDTGRPRAAGGQEATLTIPGGGGLSLC